ncbi:MAG: acetyltransferase [Rhodobacteraceae bacterium PARR1]|nr:MAG: acetyltransferase [Rhodobacteraceae bacterium PARR1]
MTKTERISSQDDQIDLRDLLGTLIAGRWTIVCCLVAGIAIGLFVVLSTAPIYKADATIELEAKASGLALPKEMLDLAGGADSRVLAEVEIIRSRLVLGETVDQLGLDITAKPRELPYIGYLLRVLNMPEPGFDFLTPYAWATEKISVSELEVPAPWVGQSLTLTALGNERYSVTLPDGTLREGRLRERLADATIGLALRVDELVGDPGREFLVARMDRQQTVVELRKMLSVAETGRQSSVLRLELRGDAQDSVMATLNSILSTYVQQNVTRGSAEAARSLEFINSQLPQSQAAVAEAQDALNAYRQQQQSVDLTFETETLLGRVTEIERKLAELALEEEEYKQRFTINHPTYQALLQNRAKLQEQLDGLRSQSGDLPETQKEVFNLTRNLEVAQNVYLSLLSRQQELQVVQASVVGNVRVLDQAFAPPEPIAPRKSVILALATVLGAVAGIGIVLLRRLFHVGVEGAEDIEKLGLAVFATVGETEHAVSSAGKSHLPILAIDHPTDLAVEALRSLRTSLHFGLLDAKTRSILITSAAPEAGKSFTAVNLAVVSAQAGQRVCLIDADLRRGYLRKFFNIERNAPGLADYLAGDVPLAQALRNGPVAGLSVMPTGKLPPNPSELIMRQSFSDLMVELDREFDLVLIDAPPTLAVTDPVIMGRSVGATIMIVRHRKTAVGEVEAVMRTFETAGGRVAGAVLNGVVADSMSYGNKYYYYNRRYSYKSE